MSPRVVIATCEHPMSQTALISGWVSDAA